MILWKQHNPTGNKTYQYTRKKAGRCQPPAKKTEGNLARKREENRYIRKKTMATRYQTAQSIQRTARRGSNGPNGKSDKPYSQTTTDMHRRKNNCPLIELLNNIAGKDNYIIKQIKIDQVKVHTNTPETFRKVIKALKEKNAIYHTYQLKTLHATGVVFVKLMGTKLMSI